MRLPTRLLARVPRRLGRRPRAVLIALAGLPRRLGRRPLASLPRRLGRRPLAVLIALAGAATAVGMSAGSPDREAKRPSRPAPPAQADGASAVLSGIVPSKRVAERQRRRPRRGGAAHYRRTARRHVTEKGARAFLPLYREAARTYLVNWRLIASVHRQETAFSTAPSTYRGLNDFGCCAGPMQFNVTNGPVSTWELYRQAFRDGRRPKRYPHRTRKHPSIYDDFDAIMAAGKLLSDSGAGPSLDSGAWRAAYSYYGHDLYGVSYASQVLARAVGWEQDGFCPNCPVDEGLVAEFDDRYGAAVRRTLLAEEDRRKKNKKRKDKADRRKGGDRDSRTRAKRRSRARRPRPSRPPSARKRRPTKPSPPRPRRTGPAKPSPPSTTPTQPATPPSTTAPAPPAGGCPPLRKLLGC